MAARAVRAAADRRTHVSPCYEYRDQRADEIAEAYGARLARRARRRRSTSSAPRHVIAFVAETVVGATLGAVPPVPGYFKRVREICDRHGILLILDEVMCGMGRTGTLHACEQEGVVPDLMAIAKGLGGGYQPIGARAACTARSSRRSRDGCGFFQHGHTYIGPSARLRRGARRAARDPSATTCSPTSQRRARVCARRLHERFGNHPHVGDIRGRGLFHGVELVADRGTKAPFDPALQAACAGSRRRRWRAG